MRANYGEKIRSIHPKRIYFIGMSSAGAVLFLYGCMTTLFIVMIPAALLFAYGVIVIVRERVDFFQNVIVIYKLTGKTELWVSDIDRIAWVSQVPYNMALAAQHKNAMKCTVFMKTAAAETLDCGLYKKLEEQMREYARSKGIQSDITKVR